MISEQLKQEVQDWIKNDPDKKTSEQLSKWLAENNEKDLNFPILTKHEKFIKRKMKNYLLITKSYKKVINLS